MFTTKKNGVEEHFKFKVTLPLSDFLRTYGLVEEHFKIKVTLPNKQLYTFVLRVEEHFKVKVTTPQQRRIISSSTEY